MTTRPMTRSTTRPWTRSTTRSMLLAATLAASAPEAEAATFTVTNTNASGAGSLKQAILDANATKAADTIQFNIAGIGLKSIAGALPPISTAMTIDGYTQPGASANTATDSTTDASLRIQLDGTGLPVGSSVLAVNVSGTVIRGLVINGIPGKGAGVTVGDKVTDASIQGCFIGTTAKGQTASSGGNGVVVDGTATIGGGTAADRNLISGNPANGVLLRGPGSFVFGNLIGTDAAGNAALGNGVGVQLTGAAAHGNLVGSGLSANANTIAGNGKQGILATATAGPGNSFLRNRIFSNGALGIDLKGDGPTFNDDDDSDTGPNRLQNAPEIDAARVNGATVSFEGVLRAAPGNYIINSYLSDSPDPSGFGEAERVGGNFNVLIPFGQEAVTFRLGFNLQASATAPFFLCATATRGVTAEDLETSEFSRTVPVPLGGGEIEVTNTADSGPGSLRAALDTANSNPNPNTIVFQIPGDGPHVIQPLTGLVIDEAPVLVDGYSQPGSHPNTRTFGSDADIRVEIDGSQLVNPSRTFDVFRTTGAIRGLAIHSSPSQAIRLVEASGFTIDGCFIGTDVTGTTDLGNGSDGIQTGQSTGCVIGGPSLGNRNVISGNGVRGIQDAASGSHILNNVIGATADGLQDLGNEADGILASGSGAVIGGDQPGLRNLIRGNLDAGILVFRGSSGVSILGNDIFSNGGLGIDLAEGLINLRGVTDNDADDADTGQDGGNALQNHPELAEVTAGASVLTVKGSLDVPADRVGTAYTIRLFRSADCDGSGSGEGEEFLGAVSTLIPAGEDFTVQVPASLVAGDQVTATATDPVSGDTSEFSACLEVAEQPPLCGDATPNGQVQASDALTVLAAAVGNATCELCICDVNDSSAITTSDALLVLKKSVGQGITLVCPVCS